MHSEIEGVELGHYRLSRLLGSGGMGEVYLARDLALGRDVAIKFVSAGQSADDSLKRRLLKEAQAVAALDHPGICPVHDVGVDSSGRAYMVMQYVQGETLAARLARGALPVGDALTWCAQIADALAAAHRRGIIHRDLKPQNVIITPSGQPKLLDFGIAKLLPASDAGSSIAETASALTDAHAFVGTPAYMSPEQVQQRPLDPRSDIFSLGAILFECLTGRRAFDGRQTIEVLGQVLHVHPPAASRLRPGLEERHDELCRRLLAKEPADRFQSAEEVVGAVRLLQPDTSRGDSHDPPIPPVPRGFGKRTLLAAALMILAAAIGLSVWLRPAPRTVPPEAAIWYDRGTESLREGSFHSAAAALEEGIKKFPDYPIGYARLAEARAEGDDEAAAREALLRLTQRFPDRASFRQDERLRLDGIQAIALHNVDDAVRAYGNLAQRNPRDASAWLDLGRAQETAGQLTDARASYERAIASDGQYAAGYLRLGIIEGALGRHVQSLAAFDEAGRLYRASSNHEGEAEVLIQRGARLDAHGDYLEARAVLDQALAAARTVGSPSQILRAQMSLSSVTASEGRLADAERLASLAVQSALEAGLETIAADGLINLGTALMQAGRPDEAEIQLRKAQDLAVKRGALRTAARGRTQMAALHLNQGRPKEALQTVQSALEYFKGHKYRRWELTALSIAASAYQQLGDIPKAHDLASEVLREAEATKDDLQVSQALAILAAQATTLGSLPEALRLRERGEAIHRRQNDVASLPFDLTNRAELLIRLGRFADADAALGEVEAGIMQGNEVYVGRKRRVTFLRALAATVTNHFQQASALASAIPADPSGSGDSASVLGPALAQYAAAKQGRRVVPGPQVRGVSAAPPILPAVVRERQYWSAAADLARSNARAALATASAGVDEASKIGNDELQWRLAAIGSIAARATGRTDEQQHLGAMAAEALARLRSSWGSHASGYERRPDLVELRKAAGL